MEERIKKIEKQFIMIQRFKEKTEKKEKDKDKELEDLIKRIEKLEKK